VIRNSDGTPWNWQRAAVGWPVLAAGATWGFHTTFDLSWWASLIATGCGFGLAAILWFGAYWFFARPIRRRRMD
jgi:hypothetical protein